jgi:L-arabinonolactonase
VKADLLVDARARLGECALWCDLTGALYWTDIENSTLSRWHAADGRLRQWTLPERVGSFALCHEPSQLLLGLASGIALFDLEREALTPIVPVEPEQPRTRINDGRCDAQGRFVFGMFDQAARSEPIGHFCRVDSDLSVERLPLPSVAVANSIAFSPDGSRLYYADSPTREIHCCDYHADGRIGPSRLFARLPSSQRYPDGSTVDADGGLWNAQWQGSCVVRYDNAGNESVSIRLPTSQPTSVVFGGPLLDHLFVTSARAGLDGQTLRVEPNAGGVFSVNPGWRGLPEHRFMTDRRAGIPRQG